MHYKILDLIEKTETTKFGRFCYYLFLPVFAILEFITFKHYFGLVKRELFTDDEFIAFLDRNEFAYKDNSFVKMDLIPNTSVNKQNVAGVMKLIRNEIAHALIEKIKNTTPIEVEQYLNVSVIILKETREIPAPHYKALIRYFRYHIVKQNYYFLPLYLGIAYGVFVLTTFLLTFLK